MAHSFEFHLTCKPMVFRSKIRLLGIVAAVLLATQTAFGQFGVQVTGTPEEMALETFAHESVKIRNVRYKGVTDAVGLFASADSTPFFTDGLLLSTGVATAAAGANSQAKQSKALGGLGDRNLDALCRHRTFDAAILEFDFMCARDSLTIEFFFASDEYNEMVGNTFGDIVGIWVTGPGLGQGVNLAKMPDGQFVSVNSVNYNVNRPYFVDNNPFNLNGQRLPDLEKRLNPAVLNHFQYDGMTKALATGMRITPKEVYHIKIGIADVGDGEVDSGVFFRKGGFRSSEQLWRIRAREAREAKRIADSLAHAQFIADSIAHEQFVADSMAHAAWVLDSIRVADSLAKDAQAQREVERLRFLTDSIQEAQKPVENTPAPENVLPPQQDPVEIPDQPQSSRQKRWGPDDAAPKRPTALSQIEPEKEPTVPPPMPENGPMEGSPELGNEFTQYIVRFDSGSSRIPEEARIALRKMADQMTAQPETQAALFVIGDDELGQQIRTSAVKYYFIGAGAPEQRVNVLEHTIPENPPPIQFRYGDEVLILVRLLQR